MAAKELKSISLAEVEKVSIASNMFETYSYKVKHVAQQRG